MNIASSKPLIPLRRISPSRFYAMTQCALREVWRSGGQGAPLPKGPGAWLGQAIHSLLERAGKHEIDSSETIDQAWESAISEVERQMQTSSLTRHLVPLSKTAPNFEIRRRQVLRLATEILARKRGATGKANSEMWLQTADGIVGGKVDRLVIGTDGATISDFKTGSVLEDPSATIPAVKHEYRVQLFLYAALYKGETGTFPVRLQVIGLDGTPLPVAFDPNECEKSLEDSRRAFARINEIVSSQRTDSQKQADLASPSARTCRYCEFRPWCLPYLSQPLPRTDSTDWPLDVVGHLAEKRTLGNGRLWLRVATVDESQRIIRGLDPARHDVLRDSPSTVGIFSLGRDSVPNSYLETPTTTVYAQ